MREIPRSQFARIRTLVKYGMTVAQVAKVYGVAVDEIARFSAKPDRNSAFATTARGVALRRDLIRQGWQNKGLMCDRTNRTTSTQTS